MMRKHSVAAIVFLMLIGLVQITDGTVCKSSKDCGQNAVCRSKERRCQCKKNYIGDGKKCEYLPDNLLNVAQHRPAYQSSIEHINTDKADFAADGNKDKCTHTQKSSNPYWRVDLGKSVWVEKVLIANDDLHELSNVEIRIGDNKDSDRVYNPLCRQGLKVPIEPWLYSCPEPMLGRYVYIRLVGKGVLTLCEVEAYVNGEAKNSDWKYLVSNGRYRYRGSFVRSQKETVFVHVPSKGTYHTNMADLVIDRPPAKTTLGFNYDVIMPLNFKYVKDKIQTFCGPSTDHFIDATIISSTREDKYLVKAVYTPTWGVDKKEKEEQFTCSLKDLRLRGNVCKLDAPCPQFSRCDTTYINPAFPPAAYYCTCEPGYEPSVRRPGNFILPDETCVKQNKLAPFIKHSRQNLALGMKTTASSTDNYSGCKHKHCKEAPGSSQLAVDGSFDTCFLSLTEYSPWFIVQLNGYQPIALITVVPGRPDENVRMKVFVGNTKANENRFTRCAIVKTSEPIWSVGCKTDSEHHYMWGDAVQIQTDAKELSLCEVEVYSEDYSGNIALKHQTSDASAENSVVDSPTVNGILKGDKCFSKKSKPFSWRVKFGNNVRVAVVFVLHSQEGPYLNSKGLLITVNNDGGSTECVNGPGYRSVAEYFPCKGTPEGSSVNIKMIGMETLQLCEVEVFQTTTINVAARRPAQSTNSLNGGNDHPELACDQKLDKPFITRSKYNPWWSVDLLTTVEVHWIRIVTDDRPKDLKGIRIIIGETFGGWAGYFPPGEHVATINPSDDRVQNISFAPFKGRAVHLAAPATEGEETQISFLEVEVYNGPLIDVNQCAMPDACPPNFSCKNVNYTYTCECRGGFKYEIKGKGKEREKKCVDKDECKVNGSCPLADSHCKNTFGSYRCVCNQGYKGYNDSNGRLTVCKDVDECKDPSLFKCPELTSCANQHGGYTCACAPGYESAVSGKTKGMDIKCKDEDECAKKSFSCHMNATCSNTIGSYKCICFSGLKGDGRTHCSDLDPCQKGEKCKLEHQTCQQIKGVHLCDCSEGFYHGFRKCKDKNECELVPNPCGYNSFCTNNVGSYKCKCKSGYESRSGDGKGCVDIDECKKNEACGGVAKCQNQAGTYYCICQKGYRFNDETMSCRDIDECSEQFCGPDTLCFNTDASYSCTCRTGFRSLNHTLNCTDIDECLEKTFSCDPASHCKNTHGGYDCKCKEGYIKTGQGTCEEECGVSCDEYSFCRNGKCLCLPGYSLGPYNECYEESFFLLGSGKALKSPVMLLATGLLGCLALS